MHTCSAGRQNAKNCFVEHTDFQWSFRPPESFPISRVLPAIYLRDMAPRFPTVHGSFFVVKPGDRQQKCIYLNANATIRELKKFHYEIFISRSEDEDLADSFFPADMCVAIDPSMKIDLEEFPGEDPDRLCWSDRSGKRYSLDIEDEDDGLQKEFLVAIGRALYEKKNKTSAEGVQSDDLMNMLHRQNQPSGLSDLLSAAGELLRMEVELYNYITAEERFEPMFQVPVIVTLNSAVANEDNSRVYLLMLFKSDGDRIMELEISNDMAPSFFAQSSSFVWVMNYSDGAEEGDQEGAQLCMSLKFNSTSEMSKFRDQYTVCLYEINHNESIDKMKLKSGEREYIEDSTRDDVEPMDTDDDIDEAEVRDERHIKEEFPKARSSVGNNDWNNEDLNSQLAVGAFNDRTFVVRGAQMGVFKTDGNEADLKSTVKFWDPSKNGSVFSPSKVMLHEEDTKMLLLDSKDPTKIMRMDIERGEIVDTWKGDAGMGSHIDSIHRTAKYAHLEAGQEFVGLNQNSLLRMDPRSREFIVQSKKYASGTRAKLECVATTGAGYLAVASATGDIRLYDQIGKNAKTHLPGLGDKIIGIDTSEDGSLVLATTLKYLLIIDTRVKGQEKGGFLKSMGKNKPPPRKLLIKPQDIAKYRMGEINFTPAHFNTGTGMERSIVASSGPFIITWNLRAIKLGRLDSYKIKRFRDNIVANDFKYGDDGRIVVTLPNNVGVARR